MQDFFFEDWAELYQRDPQAFEEKRRQVLESVINRAPVSQRNQLRLLQMECDAIRATTSPLDAAAQMSKLMVEKLLELQDGLLDLQIECEKHKKT